MQCNCSPPPVVCVEGKHLPLFSLSFYSLTSCPLSFSFFLFCSFNHANLQPRGLLPPSLSSNQLSRLLGNTQHRQHGVDGRDGGENTGVGNADLLEPAHLELAVHDGQLVVVDVAHARRARRVVHRVGDLAGVVADVLVALDLGAGGDLALDPLLEGAHLGDLAGRLDTVHERRGVVALRVGEVAEVKRGLDRRVRARQVQTAAGSRARDVGRHAKGHAVSDFLIAQALRVEGEGDLVAVHHDVGDVAVG